MKEFSYVITDAEGLHARPAGELVKKASTYACDVKISKDGREVDAKRIMGVMSLGIKCGMEAMPCYSPQPRSMRSRYGGVSLDWSLFAQQVGIFDL